MSLVIDPEPDITSRQQTEPLPGSLVGLTADEVVSLRGLHGFNEVLETATHPVRAFVGKFWGVSAWMLELIMVLSGILGKWPDLIVIATLLLLNAVLGFTQEQRAAGVVQALRKRLQVSARVLRDSRWQLVPARDLVPGDIVRVRSGDIIPADIRLLSGQLGLDQSALTGESAEVDGVAGSLLSSGSIVRRGEGNGTVVSIGAKTAFGKTTELVQQARPKLHIEAVIARLVRWLFVIVGALLSAVFVLALMRGTPMLDILPLALVLLMSAVPVALPVMFTVSMAVGAKELAKHGVLVARLSASEDAATMNVLCVDKTGTITMNQLAVVDVVPQPSHTAEDVLRAAALASQEANQDPIDLAILAAASQRLVFDGQSASKAISFKPFDASTRRTEAIVEQDGARIWLIKGAVKTVAQACGMQSSAIAALEAAAEAAARKGYRTLAVARGTEDGTPLLLGLVSLYDPPRPDARQLITDLRALGIDVKMLTGDALPVARQLAKEVGLLDIRRLADQKPSGDLGGTALDGADGYAEVFPEDKFTVVKRLQAQGHVTGMTGDGVNDAPALRQAEVGIAVSSATDVAKSAASVVLTDSGLANIVSLVEQGRSIYQRVLTWIVNKISRTILKAGFVSVAYLVTGKFVVSALAMLLLTFMTDFAKISLSTDNVRPSRKPETWKIGGFVTLSVVLGVAMVVEALGFLLLGWREFGLAENAQALCTFSFLTMLYFAAFSIVSARERRRFLASMPSKTLAAALIAEVLIGTALPFAGLQDFAPLPASQVVAIFVYAMLACLVINDTIKVALLRWRVPGVQA